ncbi:MAG: FAD-dependent oxidoreductase [Flaviflexus sp.]|nr:FAD-dependent oxidoreductase [Flaviflexus sp.]
MSGIVIIGGGLAGLIAADCLAGAGREVTVLEERGKLGGLIASAEVGGVHIDIGAESFRRSAEVAEFAAGFGLESLEPAGRSWIWNNGAQPIPHGSAFGIPSDPASPEVTSIIGDPARALEDLTMDPKIGRDAKNLGELVRARMGEAVLDLLVAPIATAIYSADPSRLAINPKLMADFMHTGSLAKAVGLAATGPAIQSLVGGMHQLPAALAKRAAQRGARLLTSAKVTGLEANGSGYAIRALIDGAEEKLSADHVVLATSIRPARALLEQVCAVPEVELPAGRPTSHVTLALDAPQLDEAPRGSGILCAPGAHSAKALTHLSAKWPWLREVTDLHLVRVSYASEERIEPERALADASELLGTELSSYVDAYPVRWGRALTPVTPQLRQWADSLDLPGNFTAIGAWRAGTGIASIIPHTLAEIEHLI